ncbi:PilW family protein [Pseudomonas sp. NPDC090202]|uniref:PilW family protein n=1 Tax=unclassified Pseudomonas TaxID=196821 RepID=UPI00382F7D62
MKPISSFSRQTGLSLIELMVAMLIGLFLILGVTQIFISNQSSYLFQQGQLGNQENGRFALAILNQELLKAGYRSNLVSTLPADASLAGCNFPDGAAVVAVSSTSFCVQYQTTNQLDLTCQGTGLIAADRNAITTPYSTKGYENSTRPRIVEKIWFDATSSSITCTTSAGAQQMVTGVKDVRFEYGSGTKGSRTVTAFSAAPPAADMIGAVRYSVLMQSPGTARTRDTSTIAPALQEWNTRYNTAYNDTVSIYQIVQGTTMIRNQMQ